MMDYYQRETCRQLLQALEHERPDEAAAASRYQDLAGKAAAIGDTANMTALHQIAWEENGHYSTLGVMIDDLQAKLREAELQEQP